MDSTASWGRALSLLYSSALFCREPSAHLGHSLPAASQGRSGGCAVVVGMLWGLAVSTHRDAAFVVVGHMLANLFGLAALTLLNLYDPTSDKANRLGRFIAASLLIALSFVGAARAAEPMAELDAWTAAKLMGVGVNIGNTLENTTTLGNRLGQSAHHEGIRRRVSRRWDSRRCACPWRGTPTRAMAASRRTSSRGSSEVVDWITDAGMFCVVNIHWDGGWIDSSNKEKFANTYATFSAEAERKFQSYWTQIASYFAGQERAPDLRGAERGNELRRRGLARRRPTPRSRA